MSCSLSLVVAPLPGAGREHLRHSLPPTPARTSLLSSLARSSACFSDAHRRQQHIGRTSVVIVSLLSSWGGLAPPGDFLTLFPPRKPSHFLFFWCHGGRRYKAQSPPPFARKEIQSPNLAVPAGYPRGLPAPELQGIVGLNRLPPSRGAAGVLPHFRGSAAGPVFSEKQPLRASPQISLRCICTPGPKGRCQHP